MYFGSWIAYEYKYINSENCDYFNQFLPFYNILIFLGMTKLYMKVFMFFRRVLHKILYQDVLIVEKEKLRLATDMILTVSLLILILHKILYQYVFIIRLSDCRVNKSVAADIFAMRGLDGFNFHP
ncbi:hypothetical protein ACJX0J_006309 [Zea mays]